MECVLCEEVITNPLCPGCLHDEARQWLLERGHDRLAENLTGCAMTLVQPGETRCIACGEGMAVCTYCATKEMLELVKGNQDLLREYLVYFNFDLGHLGWERDALAYLD